MFTQHHRKQWTYLHTFQVQVLGPIYALKCGCSIYFQSMGIAVVSCDRHIVPLVVI